APGVGTVLAIGTVTSQAFYALEQEVELVLAIAMIYGHELGGSEDRVLEALVVAGIASGALKLREDVLVAGGERLAVAAFRRMPGIIVAHTGGRFLPRILARVATSGVAKIAARVIPLAIGVGVGAGFDWLAVSGLGRAAVRYYGPGGPGARPLLLAPEDPSHVELRSRGDLVEAALLRLLVDAPPEESCRVAEPLPRTELVVSDLTHEHGLDRDPFGVLASRPAAQPTGHAAAVLTGPLLWRLCLQRLQLGDELLALAGVERRRVTHVVQRPLLVVQAEEQRAQRLAVVCLAPSD